MADHGPNGMDAVTEELYGLDPGDFVAARNEVARRLRTAGDRQLAAAIAKLRRPRPAAWAVNQLARQNRTDLEELVRLGEELRAAQDRALAGEPAGDLRQAARARRDAVASLVEAAERALVERGGGAGPHSSEVAATLEAASLDTEAATAVLAGRLTSALEPPSGLGVFDAPVPAQTLAPARGPEPGARPEPGPGPDERQLRQAQDAVAESRRLWEARSAQARTAVERVAQSRRAVQDSEAEVARLEDLLAQAERRLRAAVRDTENAEDVAARAEEGAAKAAQRLRHAEERLADLQGGRAGA